MNLFMFKGRLTYDLGNLDISDLSSKKWKALTGGDSRGFRAYKATYQLVIL